MSRSFKILEFERTLRYCRQGGVPQVLLTEGCAYGADNFFLSPRWFECSIMGHVDEAAKGTENLG